MDFFFFKSVKVSVLKKKTILADSIGPLLLKIASNLLSLLSHKFPPVVEITRGGSRL